MLASVNGNFSTLFWEGGWYAFRSYKIWRPLGKNDTHPARSEGSMLVSWQLTLRNLSKICFNAKLTLLECFFRSLLYLFWLLKLRFGEERRKWVVEMKLQTRANLMGHLEAPEAIPLQEAPAVLQYLLLHPNWEHLTQEVTIYIFLYIYILSCLRHNYFSLL